MLMYDGILRIMDKLGSAQNFTCLVRAECWCLSCVFSKSIEVLSMDHAMCSFRGPITVIFRLLLVLFLVEFGRGENRSGFPDVYLNRFVIAFAMFTIGVLLVMPPGA